MYLSEFEEKIGYHFHDSAVLITALTHSSAIKETKMQSNQRLEFLGDAVLQLIVSTYLYRMLPQEGEGTLSKVRSLIVCADSLHVAAQKIGLSEYLILGKGEELSGGREKKNIAVDAFESIIGAIYLDGGYAQAECFVFEQLGNLIQNALHGRLTYDYKTMLQEYAQANDVGDLSYLLVRVSGPEHDRTFYSTVVLNGGTFPEGLGQNRKQSEQHAAEMALRKLKLID
jgi:ribonuclease-3